MKLRSTAIALGVGAVAGAALTIAGTILLAAKNSVVTLYSDSPLPGIGLNYRMPKSYLDFSVDLLYQNNYYLKKISVNTLFPYANIILGLSESDNYSNFSYGVSFNFKDWEIIYASLKHEDSSLGTPVSIEISKYF